MPEIDMHAVTCGVDNQGSLDSHKPIQSGQHHRHKIRLASTLLP